MPAKKIASKPGRIAAFAPIPTPPPPPMQHRCAPHNRHGEAALSFLLFITLIVFVAVSTGLSIFNTIELSRIRHGITGENNKSVTAEKLAADETAEYGSPEQMMQKAEDIMQRAEKMMQAQIDADNTGNGTSTTKTVAPKK